MTSILIISQLSGCAVSDFFSKTSKIARFPTNKVARAQTAQASENSTPAEVEVFDLSKDIPTLTFTKSAIAQSGEIAYVIPQTSGKVAKIGIKIGDEVKKNTLLITLGDSLATDIAEIQYQTTLKAMELAKDSQIFSDDSAQKTVEVAALGVKTAYESLQNAKKAKQHAEDIYKEQKQSAKYGKETAVDAKDFANSALEKLDKSISSLKEQIANLKDTLSKLDPSDTNYDKLSETLEKLNTALQTAEGQRDTIVFNRETAARGIDQAKTGLDLLDKSFNLQEDQLNFTTTVATNQYEMALHQFELALNGTSIQKIGIDTQILQLNSASQLAKLSKDQRYIKSPISGYVTDIQAEENNFVAPGQPVVKIENPETLLLKTSVNPEESIFLTINQTVEIISGARTISGEITSISPAINNVSQKIEIEITAKNTVKIIPGSLVKIRIPIKTKQIFIPLNSLYNNSQGQFVKIVEDGKIKHIPVTIGEIVGEFMEIKSGLQGNEKIITTPNATFEENESVTIK